jgi:hypothetical protein
VDGYLDGECEGCGHSHFTPFAIERVRVTEGTHMGVPRSVWVPCSQGVVWVARMIGLPQWRQVEVRQPRHWPSFGLAMVGITEWCGIGGCGVKWGTPCGVDDLRI